MVLNTQQENSQQENEFSEDEDIEEYVSGADFRQEMQNLTPRTKVSTSWQQKFAVIFLALFGVSAVILWIIQFNSGLKVTEPLSQEELANLEQRKQSDDDLLRNQDTDGDGLSDYNELYIYNTSPYIDDTDSDGISDKTEIDSGEDPNCPTGQNCFAVDDDEVKDGQIIYEDVIPKMNKDNIDNINQVQNDNTDATQMQAILGGEADSQSLRNLLLGAGIDAGILNNFSDEQLLEVYQSALIGQ